MKQNTKLLHEYTNTDYCTGASSIPIYQASTYDQRGEIGEREYTYTRFGNPTVKVLEEAIADLENARYGFAFSSGMAAISAAFHSVLKMGDHVVMPKNVYGGAFQLVMDILKDYGIEVTFVEENTNEAWKNAIQINTRAFYVETPSNPLLTIIDIKKVVEIANHHKIFTIMDNTFMTPLYQKGLELGIDIVVHSATKFINGHSDVTAGLVVTSNEKLSEKIGLNQKANGAILGPFDAWLILRGLKTLKIRMSASIKNAEQMALFLNDHPKIKKVFYPGLSHHKGRAIHQQQATENGAVLSFDVGSKENVFKIFSSVQYPIVAVSLGGVESILSYPCEMSHASVPEKERLSQGITDGLIRFSLGIEDIEDLVEDIDQALDSL
ncbi:PLP-dependent transferase [Listeria monocytogenes]|uniref:cysteine-S-conjugate beta-lyase n=1 Tax=Listeria monocytogenes TaxID=1639 RepID=A0AAD2MIH0_LISMN|nr:PLP-dependent aspartate aminotransferase family protein [Listeria monocytogenes]MCZ62169.1 PLP-dependent transferase [Listeria monocytogenes serotype 4b]HAA0102791.1 aminotransferase class I/II-fold pyridoxal phosphate-dependent enzyme [Listeria monocytogenes CC70B]AQP73366.1 cystathionine gamma-synthase [Listeria monocytogenes]ASH66625.1 cystathionine beta-lyase [Listeria monocytogenes serotype 4b str. 02-1103]ASH69543.1 cystathionine beta-lyase [Listeria monocytogenes serotype 4b str. 02-